MSATTGNWDAVIKGIEHLDENILAAIKLATMQNCLMLEAALVLHIQNQDLGWKGLNPVYKAYKEKKKLSNQILIATSTLMNSITHEVSDDGLSGFVGVLRKAKGKKGGKNEVLIGAVHEFGSPSRNITARPLFQPTLVEKKQAVIDRYMKAVEKALQKVGG